MSLGFKHVLSLALLGGAAMTFGCANASSSDARGYNDKKQGMSDQYNKDQNNADMNPNGTSDFGNSGNSKNPDGSNNISNNTNSSGQGPGGNMGGTGGQ